MKQIILILGLVLVIGWIAFRVGSLVWRHVRRTRQRSLARATCPKCGSRRLDEQSDAESGYCLSCRHVWGVKPE